MKRYFKDVTSKVINFDYWSNSTTGQGIATSRVNSTRYVGTRALDRHVLTDLYRDDGIAKKIINLIVEDSLRGFIEAEAALLAELERLNFKQKLSDCCSYARLYGGAAIVAFSDDGSDMEKPINFNRLKKVVKLVVYDRQDIQWQEEDINTNYYDENFGEPSVYTISESKGSTIRVHSSRCYIMGGATTSRETKRDNGGWDDSALQSVYDALMNYGSIKSSSAEVVQDYSQKVVYVKGLATLASAGQLDKVRNRINEVDLSMSNAQALWLDAMNEKYEKHDTSVSGLPDLWEKFQESLSSAALTPVTKLFGTTAGGLSANSEADNRAWYDTVDSYRSDHIAPCIDWLVEMVSHQMIWLDADRPADYEWAFPPLETPNDEEMAKVKLLTAQTDSIYVGMGAIDPRQLYALRYATGIFQKDITIPEELLDLDDDIDTEGNDDLIDLDDSEEDEKQVLFKKIGKRL